jgi:hypothetical protein
MTTAERFADFARAAAEGGSPRYADWAAGVADDPELVALIDRARPSQRQPVLVFAVARLLGAPASSFAELRPWLLAHAGELVQEVDRRLTQTNDVRRVAPIAFALARIPGSVALIEVGASAGLALYPDRFAVTLVTHDGPSSLGDQSSPVRLSAALEGWTDLDPGGRLALPTIVHRGGIDLAPLDVRSADDMQWLETLLWPGQDERVELLRSAVEIAQTDPPVLGAGDAVDALPALVERTRAQVGPSVTIVVVSSGTLVYLPGARRQAFVDLVDQLGVRWISYEKSGSLSGIEATIPDPELSRSWFATLALDGQALALGDPHGTALLAL